MAEYKYILEPYKGMNTRHTCPNCGKKRRFARYINKETGEYLSDKVGRCDRENNCNYHYSPSSFFSDNPFRNTVTPDTYRTPVTLVTAICEPVQYLPFDILNNSVLKHTQTNLYPFLVKLFTKGIASRLCLEYLIGSNKFCNTVFWQVDVEGNVRQAKVIQYNPATGRRNKETGAFFAGKKILNNDRANLQQCFFGESFLSNPENCNKPVAIVESEKTAVIASVYFPGFIWLATGGKAGCKWTEANVCKVLARRKVVLFPDLGAFDAWKAKGLLLAAVAGCKVAVSDLLEINASKEDKEKGLDLADFLLRNEDSTGMAMTDINYPVIWDLKKN